VLTPARFPFPFDSANWLILLAVPARLERATFGLGMRCVGPRPDLVVPTRLDLSTLLAIGVPAYPSDCHPIPPSWVAKWVAKMRRCWRTTMRKVLIDACLGRVHERVKIGQCVFYHPINRVRAERQ
jgi:hypothetical protein